MYKLTVVAGPNRGSSYAIQEGENTVGRQAGNTVVLTSAKVSKRHCVLVVSDGEVVLQDQGSSNGTFVNGELSKAKRIQAGDRISVGEYVLQLVEANHRSPQAAPAVPGFGNVVKLPTAPARRTPSATSVPSLSSSLPGINMPPTPAAPKPGFNPQEIVKRLSDLFEAKVMPVFYELNFRHEWRIILIGLFAAMVFANVVISVYPLLDSSANLVVKEAQRRAVFMAREISEHNTAALGARMETKTDVGSIEFADGVRLAVLTDMDGRIIAPSSKLNQYLTGGEEAVFVAKKRPLFLAGREAGVSAQVDSSTVVAIEPVRVVSTDAGKNVNVGLAVVALDITQTTPDWGEMGMVYCQSILFTGLLGGIILLILYRLTLRPYHVLNDDMDKVLKGDLPQVTHEFKVGELNPLWDLINSTLQRVPRNSEVKLGMDGVPDSMSLIDQYSCAARMLGELVKFGLVICDPEGKIVFLNPVFEEISGIRPDGAVGQPFSAVARDQALTAFTTDMLERAQAGGATVVEDYEFSGVTFKVHAAAFGPTGYPPKCFLLAFIKGEEA